ncbi:MAG: hypothetical protein A3A94_03540 [Candidatus Portnoybacteria bacterium RIFCSPLOWO2_01_FULL_43_11]|uniref:NAD-dependent epimerase/dehydratase domain-containing protein n=4 Tax=Bacteria candidate phyla TaxID=1783234 RepID=A0A1G2FSW2_9BACT|nr:MAG: hypothetical protein A2713_01875 [candidate division WWE3 bacterium RIFCSPHIGHO2_01_FULL_35_17]OGZ37903.1 MAG: hypothetical protein A3E90_01525 [Candidatus Portnoybacteria bacterium RIFCSPHIGHO2_12_FULL_40_11]OGZ38423.1 MAG: hypothetical protein A3A94_03540 [Candidatus Portnoybacteria bacterium RIFCSPLOWO2_01_FULL_43_11]OGZ40822.1 MAG: hypothetical protein A3I20_02355 [Candidatus Portnoybacteria bacterium RIFCSPLOWO2_02_FULL_40_15]
MKILVTGASGFIGSHLVRVLIAAGHEVRVLVREFSRLDRLKDLKDSSLEITEGSLEDKDSLIKAVSGIKVIFHLAGQLGKFGLSNEVYYRTHVLSTKNLLEVSLGIPDFKQFIFTSTIGVFGPFRGEFFTESYTHSPTNIYEKTKSEAEKLVLEFIKNGFPATIIRPGLVYGPGDLHVLDIFKAVQNKKFFLIGRGENIIHPVYIDDLISGFLSVLNNSRAIGQSYNICGKETIKLKDFLEIIAKGLNVKLPKLKIPVWFAFLVLYPLVFLSKIFRFDPILTKSRLRFFIDSRASSIVKAQKELAYQPKFAFNEGVRLTIEAQRRKGFLK